MAVIAKSLDVVVLLKLLIAEAGKPYAELSRELGISASEIHAAVHRGVDAGLLDGAARRPLLKPLEEYLIHGVRYAFPARRGPVARGIPTAYAASPLAEYLGMDDLPPVWPDPEGTVKGFALEPLHPAVPKASRQDSKLYELLALVDALRIGRSRDRKLADLELKKRITHAVSH